MAEWNYALIHELKQHWPTFQAHLSHQAHLVCSYSTRINYPPKIIKHTKYTPLSSWPIATCFMNTKIFTWVLLQASKPTKIHNFSKKITWTLPYLKPSFVECPKLKGFYFFSQLTARRRRNGLVIFTSNMFYSFISLTFIISILWNHFL